MTTPPKQPAPTWSPTHRHRLRGTSYVVTGSATLQRQQSKPLPDETEMTVYRDRAGKLWVRATAEFNDGRLEQLSASSRIPEGGGGATSSDLKAAFSAGWWVNAVTPGEDGAGSKEYFDRCCEVDWRDYAALSSPDTPAGPKMLVDADWLRRKIETDPDLETEARPGPDTPAPGLEDEAAMREDAEQWRALMRCGRIKMQGSSGVDPKTLERNGNNIHFGAEFWPEPADEQWADHYAASTAWGKACLKALVAAIRNREGSAPPLQSRAPGIGGGE